ncbi:MAG TPA: pilus assembly PilX N-terminal domain-containing protein [candidate division Zixibacteria bacterium]|nr:pilus assembly PilX N-terminal domain-containing protein [candidate division Zixibacteria bacterium]
MNKFLSEISNNRGSAILIVIALIAMLTAVAIVSIDRSNSDLDLAGNQVSEEQAFYAAESGAERALVELNANFAWRGPILDAQIDGRKYAVILLDSSWNPALMDTILIKSTANYSSAVVNLESWVAPDYFRPFEWAAFGADSVIMRNTGCTDSYNSDSGTYSSTVENDYGSVGSNGYIKLSNTANINGGAETAQQGGITTDNSSSVNGDTSTTVPAQQMDFVTDAEYAWAKTTSSAPGGLSGKYSYNSTTYALTLNNKYDTLVLTSGVYYFSSISLGEQSSIKLAPGAEVTIYMTGNMSLNQGASVNPGGIPSDFFIYSKGTQLNINQGTEFRAAFWGPNANIKVEQNTSVYGALSGKSVRVVNSACIHYDRSLLRYTRDEIERMKMVAWRQI